MQVRPATIADIDTIRTIAYATWPVAYGQILSREQLAYMLELIYSTQALEKQFEEGHVFFIAEDGENQAIGFAGCSEVEPNKSWKLHKLYVLPNIQKSGAGKVLMQSVIDTAKANNASELLLNVNRHNPAYNYYIKNNFEVVDTVDISIGGGYFMNDYVMMKKI